MEPKIAEQNPQDTLEPNSRLFIPKNFILIGLACLTIITILTVFFIKTPKKAVISTAEISGNIAYTALKPDPQDRGQVEIKYRKYNSNDSFATFYTSAPYNKSWDWKNAVSGQPYEIKADLVIDGKLVTSSEPLIVTAPADNQVLNLRVTWHNLPESVVREQTTSIKGEVSVNGYIPSDGNLLILAKSGSDSFQTVATIPNPRPKNSWIWEKTVPLKDYSMKAVLMKGNTQIGGSQTITAAGGDNSINFTINSSALPDITPIVKPVTAVNTPTPQPTQGNITGLVNINGPEQENTSLLMLWRNPGDKDYQVITRINNPSHNGQTWNWNNQKIGKQYEITAVLQVNQQNSASAQSQVVTVPAQNINFTLNTGVVIPTPDGRVTVNACNNIGSNQYNAVISFPKQNNAGNYWIQVGRSNSASDIFNSKIQPNSNNPQITIQINGNQSYYAQYAYSLCSGCSEDSNFSNFSQSNAFSCGGGPAYTGYRCNSSNFTCQLTTDNNPPYPFNNSGLEQCQRDCRPTPTSTPTPQPTSTPTPEPTSTPTPKISSCNQSCGGNGYTCDTGLVCFNPGGGIGSDVCRNPDCTSDTNCNCLPQ